MSAVRSLVILGLLATALSLVAPAATKTRVEVFSPWSGGTLRAGYTVVRKAKGGPCWENSLSTDRPDAWRCFIGNDIYDPCFSGTSRSDVACLDDAFAHRVFLLHLSKPLVAEKNPTTQMLQPSGQPWALRLSNGDQCGFMTGATTVLNGDRMNYGCKSGNTIFGFPNRSSALWTAKSVPWPKHTVTNVGVAVAIF